MDIFERSQDVKVDPIRHISQHDMAPQTKGAPGPRELAGHVVMFNMHFVIANPDPTCKYSKVIPPKKTITVIAIRIVLEDGNGVILIMGVITSISWDTPITTSTYHPRSMSGIHLWTNSQRTAMSSRQGSLTT